MAKATMSDLFAIIGFEPSPEQLAAITAPLEPGIIIAGAGTGKTTVMSARIAWLVMTEQVLPEQILGLTFTKKAAQELLTRVRKLMPSALEHVSDSEVQANAGDPMISTYNSFGARLLSEHGLRLGYEPDARVVVDATRYQLAMRVVRDTTIDLGQFGYNPVDAVTHMMKLDEQLSNYLVEPDALIEYEHETIATLKQIAKQQKIVVEMTVTAMKRQALAQLVQEFRQAKKQNAIIDYSDQIRLAATAAKASNEMCRLLREQYAVVLLDEYQDTSKAQMLLLQSLFGNGHPVMAVGDPCQAIYGWRGAEISNMDSFTKDFPLASGADSRQYNLTANRRSRQEVLTAANGVSAPLRDIHESIQDLVAGEKNQPPGVVHVGLLDTFRDEVEWIADEIAKLDVEEDWSKVAVLLREKKNTDYFVDALERRDIPVQVVSPDALVNLPEVRDVLSYLQVITDPCANAALVRIMMGPRWRIGARDMALLGKHARYLVRKDEDDDVSIDVILDRVVADVDKSERVSLLDALEDVEGYNKLGYSQEAQERMVQLASMLRSLRRHAGESAVDVIARVIRMTGIGVEALARPMGEGGARFDRLAALLELAGDFRNLDGHSSLSAFLAFIRDSERFSNLPDAEVVIKDNAVVIMTVHQSKGLEFPFVAIPDLTAGVFPGKPKEGHWPKRAELLPVHLKGKDKDDPLTSFPPAEGPRSTNFETYTKLVNSYHVLDERRLAYVAVTRAKQAVIASSSWWGPTQKETRGPSEFLKALHEHATEKSTWAAKPEDGARNPLLGLADYPEWPVPIDTDLQSQLVEQAALVNSFRDPAALDAGAHGLDLTGLSAHEQKLIQDWANDIEVLFAQVDSAQATTREVRLPRALTASQTIAFVSDQESFLKSLVRPMPRKPSAVASRGTAFHAWVEDFYGQRPLIDLDSLPGSGDSEIYDDKQLDALKQAFESGVFAERMTKELEEPFALVVGGHTLRGRIDAIFKGSLADPAASDHWTVVDWKTGAPGSADELQLSIYRLAVADIKGVSPEQIDVAFYYVADKLIHEPESTLSLDELTALLSQ
jgi:DNA helicase-2/ATP-dependent DNA helicase PcrA